MRIAFLFHILNQKTGYICDALHNLVPFVQFKKRKKHPWMSFIFSRTEAYNFIESKTPPWVFFKFLNCTNDIKSRNLSHIVMKHFPACGKRFMLMSAFIQRSSLYSLSDVYIHAFVLWYQYSQFPFRNDHNCNITKLMMNLLSWCDYNRNYNLENVP